MILSKIIDGFGAKFSAKVSRFGQFVTGPLDFSEFHNVSLITNNIPLSLINPIMGKHFIITDIIIYGSRDVGVNDATVSLYESDELDGITARRVILPAEIPKNDRLILTGLNIITSQGSWITAVTDDNTVFVTVGGYFAAPLK